MIRFLPRTFPFPRLRRQRLATALLLLLVPLLLLLSLFELRVTAGHVHRAADAAYDRSLLGALKSIEASVSTESGGLAVELPYRLFEFFELTASGPVYYRIATEDGLVELGSADLPLPPEPLQPGVPQFYDGSYFGAPVRVVAYSRELERPAEGSRSSRIVIQVAESTKSRDAFRSAFLRRSVVSHGVFLLLAIGLSVGSVIFVLRPLQAVSRELATRPAGELSPMPSEDLPADVRPLVDAMNSHMQRVQELAGQQRAFLDDASHQLRTHLTTLRMQVDFALRERDPVQVREALAALAGELQRATRGTNQMLSLARSDAAELQPAWFDARELLEDVVREFLPAARAKGLDLGLESPGLRVWGDAGLVREALGNLVANAIAYVDAGQVTLEAAGDELGWSIGVADTGAGLPAEVRASVGTRFLRRNTASKGSGLGLAIAQAVARRHAGVLRLESANTGGLRATLWWPRPASIPAET